MRVGFIIGHHEKSKGAYSETLKSSEWDLFRGLESQLSQIGKVYYHNSAIGSYTQRCIDISKRIGKECDIIFALHFNAANKTANGCEAFHWHTNVKGKDVATKFVKYYTDKTGARSRGVKKYSDIKTERGAGEVYYPQSTVVLLEPFFGDNAEDCKKYSSKVFLDAIKESIK